MTMIEEELLRKAALKSKYRLNGMKCPKCEKELVDTNPNRLLLSSPPKKEVLCQSCGYSGYRKA